MDISNKNFKDFREYLGLDQGGFASILGVDPSYISQIENGKKPVTAPLLRKLRDKFHIDPEKITGKYNAD